jgi:hypothetical protein
MPGMSCRGLRINLKRGLNDQEVIAKLQYLNASDLPNCTTKLFCDNFTKVRCTLI